MENNEQWRQIEGFPGYSISSFGHVKGPGSKGACPNGRVMKPWIAGNSAAMRRGKAATLKIYLYKGSNRARFVKSVHRLVLEGFVGPCPDGQEACHEDGNFRNNKLDNLRWDTRAANMQDAIRHETHNCVKRKKLAKVRECERRAVREGIFWSNEFAYA